MYGNEPLQAWPCGYAGAGMGLQDLVALSLLHGQGLVLPAHPAKNNLSLHVQPEQVSALRLLVHRVRSFPGSFPGGVFPELCWVRQSVGAW